MRFGRWIRNLLIVICALALQGRDFARPLFAIEGDKIIHSEVAAAAGSTCALAAHWVTNKALVGGLGCFLFLNGLGLIKELTDPLHGGQRETADLMANAIGSGIGIFAVTLAFGISSKSSDVTPEVRPIRVTQSKQGPPNSSLEGGDESILRFEIVDGQIRETVLKSSHRS